MSEAVCPAGISSFFEICDVDQNGNRITDPSRIGARGGGFAIERGVRARVTTRKSSKPRISIRINSRPAPEANTTRWAIEHLLTQHKTPLDVLVDLKVSVPIAAGFGTSAAGTAASCLALADAAGLHVTFNELGEATHIAEVINRTGLGTAAALFVGGFVLVTEPGAPGIGAVDRLMFPDGNSVICVYLESMPTRDALSQTEIADRVNPLARQTMTEIRTKPDLATFLTASRKFTYQAGFMNPGVKRVIGTMTSAGAVGAAQNMIGQAVHGVIEDRKADQLVRLVRRRFPSATVFATRLDERGVRLSLNAKPKH